ncbi:hypothetical protein [Thalassoglobus sp.]|uniref:hypothetical protein n=1 Tax=Thalassoglobus sp. TaxID=2795869 RepID=UPI003AA95FB0
MLEQLLDQVVVLDMSSPFIFIGTLVEEGHRYLVLKDVDVHDLRDSSSTREVYVHEVRTHGLAPNRKRVLVQKDRVVSLSRLSDVY